MGSSDIPLQPFLNSLLQPAVFDRLPHGYLLGLYGAFGFDLALDVHRIKKLKPRRADHRDAVLYFPTTFIEFDAEAQTARRVAFSLAGVQNAAVKEEQTFFHAFALKDQAGHVEELSASVSPVADHTASIARVKEHIGKGDVFEIVMSKRYSQPLSERPSEIFRRICQKRPAPYSFFLNLGNREYLLATSPEMVVRVQGDQVEARPIAGSIARGKTAIEDEHNIRTLLNSDKIRAELMMCSDVALQ